MLRPTMIAQNVHTPPLPIAAAPPLDGWPPLPIAAIPLPDGMAAPLAAHGAVPHGLFG